MSLGSKTLHLLALAALGLQLTAASAEPPRNVILFVPDGLRALAVTPETAPTMAAIRDQGVNFANPHSLFPTFTMPNSSGMATGHYLGDTGAFSNTIYVGFPTAHAAGSVTPFIESDTVLGDIDDHFSGNFVDEDAILFAARHQGFSTAAIGPDFKSGFVSDAPVSNADVGKTVAQVLGLKIPFHGALMGRMVEEALPGGSTPAVQQFVERANRDANGLATILVGQRVGQTRYFDAAGFSSRTVGVDERKAASR